MYRVVIVDDEVLIRMYIREILENNGYEAVSYTHLDVYKRQVLDKLPDGLH